MEKGTLLVNTNNLMPIIKKWLYSEKDIFLRELISNASDAISKQKIVSKKKENHQINIFIDETKKTLTIKDTGIGMTKKEVKEYIAQIAYSGAEKFIEKYKSNKKEDQFIGHFGLGFYSAYMVASKVDIKTKSEKSSGVFWTSDGSSSYEIDNIDLKKRGTEIILHINEDNVEYLKEEKIKELLKKYCPYLSYEIYVNKNLFPKKDPLWLKSPSSLKEKDYLDFYKELYPFENDPIFWIHINVDYPFHVRGILYFPKINNLETPKSNILLFCNRVFVSNNCKDILPDYLMVLKGAIDSPDIPLNVSRSYLQSDSTVKKLGSHISKKITDRLNKLFTMEKEKFLTYWQDIETIIKLGILQDEKFYKRSKDFLIFKNSKNERTTCEDYIERNENLKKIFYSHDENSNFLNLYKEKNIEVLFTNPHIDTAILNYLEPKLDIKFQRIDGNVDDIILDKEKEETLLDKDGKTKKAKMEDFFKKLLDTKVEAKSLSSNDVYGFIMLNEDERRFRDYMNLTKNDFEHTPTFTFIVNTNNKLINKVYSLKDKNEELAKNLLEHLLNLSRLSQKEMKQDKIPEFIKKSQEVLEKLADFS